MTPAPPEAVKQAAFVVWAEAASGSGTKGGKKDANPLRANAALSHCGPSAPGESGIAGRPAPQQKASKSCPRMKDGPGRPRSPQQTQAWPRAWEGAGLSRQENTVKSTAPGGGPRANPCLPCAFPSHTHAPGWGKGTGEEGRGCDPRSSLKRQALSGALCMQTFCVPCSALFDKWAQQGGLAQSHPAAAWQSGDRGSQLGPESKFAHPRNCGLLSQGSPTTSVSHSNPWAEGETEAQGQKVIYPRSQTS